MTKEATPPLPDGLVEARRRAAREVEGDSDNPLRVREANVIYAGERDDSDIVQRHLTALTPPAPVAEEELAAELRAHLSDYDNVQDELAEGALAAWAWNNRNAILATLSSPQQDQGLVDALAELSSYVGAGLGDENTTPEQYIERIRWGIDHLNAATVQRCADVVEECSKRPKTKWGEVRSAVLALAQSAEGV